MRKTKILNFIVATILVTTGYSSKAQTITEFDSLFVSPQDQIDHIFNNVDFSEITSNHLYEHGFPFYAIERHDGTNIHDSLITNLHSFLSGYASFFSMAISNQNQLPEPTHYQGIINSSENPDLVEIAVLNMDYHRLKSDALSNNLMYESGGQLFDVANRPESPYELQKCFMASPMNFSHKGLSMSYRINTDLYYSNDLNSISSIEINVDDGRGFIATALNQVLPVVYEDAGMKQIIVKMSFSNGATLYSKSEIQIEESNQNRTYNSWFFPDQTHEILPTPNHNGAKLSVYYACGHFSLQKPLIWVEGFNPKSLVDAFPDENLRIGFWS